MDYFLCGGCCDAPATDRRDVIWGAAIPLSHAMSPTIRENTENGLRWQHHGCGNILACLAALPRLAPTTIHHQPERCPFQSGSIGGDTEYAGLTGHNRRVGAPLTDTTRGLHTVITDEILDGSVYSRAWLEVPGSGVRVSGWTSDLEPVWTEFDMHSALDRPWDVPTPPGDSAAYPIHRRLFAG